MHPRTRRRYSNDSGVGRFAALLIRTGRFADDRYITFDVEQVVLNLECEAEIARVTIERLLNRRREMWCTSCGHHHARMNQCAGFAVMHDLHQIDR